MNIEQAKSVPLANILHILGCDMKQHKNGDLTGLSPLRNENTPSFHVYGKDNRWHDFGSGKGGDTIDLVCAYLETQGVNNDVSDALRWITNMCGYAPVIQPINHKEAVITDKKLEIRNIEPLKSRGLIRYLEGRGIPLILAVKHLKEITIYNNVTGKSMYAIGSRNEVGGWELRNKFWKGCIGRKDVTVIRGTTPKSDGVHVFEGTLDYLSAVMHKKDRAFKDDSIILNSVSILTKATPYIKGYGYKSAYTWMDNDKAGIAATQSLDEFFKTEDNLFHYPQNAIYTPHKDVNAWHMNSLGL